MNIYLDLKKDKRAKKIKNFSATNSSKYYQAQYVFETLNIPTIKNQFVIINDLGTVNKANYCHI